MVGRGRLRVYTIRAPQKIVNWTQQTYRWGPRKQEIYVQGIRSQPLIRWTLDHERAEEMQRRFEAHISDAPIDEAWIEFLQVLSEVGILKV